MKKLHSILGLLLLAFAGSAQAISMADLLNGGSITAGDKTFDQWQLIFEDYSDPALTVDPANIEVTALNDGGLDPGPGLHFSASAGALDVTGDGIYAYIDYMFGFRVTAGSGYLIKDNSLEITNGFVTNSGDNGMFIQEFVGTDSSLVDVPGDVSLPDLAIKDVEFSWLDPGPAYFDLTDSASFDPMSQIWVSKDIFIWATDVDESAGLDGFTQRFSQVAVPEPTTFALLSLGLAGLGFTRRRMKA